MRFNSFLIAITAAAAIVLPGVSHAANITEGRRAWLQYNCSGCHGNNAGGGMGPAIRGAGSGDVSQAMNGDATEGGMRSFKTVVPTGQLPTIASNIGAYLATIGTKKEPTWLDWWNANP